MSFGFVRSAVVLAVVAATPAWALDINQAEGSDDKIPTILLTGSVVVGDGLRVRSVVGKLGTSKPIIAHLGFGGGNQAEAMSIGRFFHKLRIRTIVPAKARCISPCPLVLVGGRDPDPKQWPYIKYSSSTIGFSNLNPNYQDTSYGVGDLDKTVAAIQSEILRIADYLQEVGADINILRFYQSALKPKEVKYITNEQALDLGIGVIMDETGELIAPLKR